MEPDKLRVSARKAVTDKHSHPRVSSLQPLSDVLIFFCCHTKGIRDFSLFRKLFRDFSLAFGTFPEYFSSYPSDTRPRPMARNRENEEKTMTTAAAEARYLAEHMSQWGDRGYAVFNPHQKPVDELPVIYGFNNGGSSHFLEGALISEDGAWLGGHGCSAEGYMYHDLGIVEGSRPDRHEAFQKHYPDGYRMDFVPYSDVMTHPGLSAAVERNKALPAAEPDAA